MNADMKDICKIDSALVQEIKDAEIGDSVDTGFKLIYKSGIDAIIVKLGTASDIINIVEIDFFNQTRKRLLLDFKTVEVIHNMCKTRSNPL